MISRELHNKFLRKYTKVSIAVGENELGIDEDDMDGVNLIDAEGVADLPIHTTSLYKDQSAVKPYLDKLFSRCKEPYGSANNPNSAAFAYSGILTLRGLNYPPIIKADLLFDKAAASIANRNNDYIKYISKIFLIYKNEIGVEDNTKKEELITWYLEECAKPGNEKYAKSATYTEGMKIWNNILTFYTKFLSVIVNSKKFQELSDLKRNRNNKVLGSYTSSQNMKSYSPAAHPAKFTNSFSDFGGVFKEYIHEPYLKFLIDQMVVQKKAQLIGELISIVNRYTHTKLYEGSGKPSDGFIPDFSKRDEFIKNLQSDPKFLEIEKFAKDLLPKLVEHKVDLKAGRDTRDAQLKAKNDQDKADKAARDQQRIEQGLPIEEEPVDIREGFDLSQNLFDKQYWTYVNDFDPEFKTFIRSLITSNPNMNQDPAAAVMKALAVNNPSLFVAFSKGVRKVINMKGTGGFSEEKKKKYREAVVEIWHKSKVYQETISVLEGIFGTKQQQQEISDFTPEQRETARLNKDKDVAIEKIQQELKSLEKKIDNYYGLIITLTEKDEQQECNETINGLEEQKTYYLEQIKKLKASKKPV